MYTTIDDCVSNPSGGEATHSSLQLHHQVHILHLVTEGRRLRVDVLQELESLCIALVVSHGVAFQHGLQSCRR